MNLRTTTALLNITVIALAVIAWTQTVNLNALNLISVALLLGLIGFSMMWVHYAADFLRRRYWPDQKYGVEHAISRYIVLGSILLHPTLIYTQLFNDGFGLPPTSSLEYVGTSLAPYVYAGVIALVGFLLFEFKKVLQKIGVWSYVIHFNAIAMMLIVLHAITLGPVTNIAWYLAVWVLYGLSLLAIFAVNYNKRYTESMNKKYITFTLIGVGLIALGAVTYTQIAPKNDNTTTQSQTSSSTTDGLEKAISRTVTMKEVTENNGKDGKKCWIALERKVYDATNNRLWKNGTHTTSNGRANCGEDLTEVIGQSPHGKRVLGALEVVGELSTEAETSQPAPEANAPKNQETTTLKAVGNYKGSATATRSTVDGVFMHEVTAKLDDPAEGKFYEGWLAGPSVVSTGKMTKEADGEWSLVFRSEKDMSKHTQVVITEETEADGLDNKPEAHFLEGSF